MNVNIQSPSSTLSFGNADSTGGYTSLSVVGSAVTTKGLKQAGAVLLDGTSEVSRKGVVRTSVRCRVPLFDLSSASDAYTGGTAGIGGKSPSGYAQVAITATLPNTAGIIATAADIAADGIPTTQESANAIAISLAMQILLNAVCGQGSSAEPILRHGMNLMDYTLLGEDVQNNPIARGLMGVTPLSGADRGIAAAAS